MSAGVRETEAILNLNSHQSWITTWNCAAESPLTWHKIYIANLLPHIHAITSYSLNQKLCNIFSCIHFSMLAEQQKSCSCLVKRYPALASFCSLSVFVPFHLDTFPGTPEKLIHNYIIMHFLHLHLLFQTSSRDASFTTIR